MSVNMKTIRATISDRGLDVAEFARRISETPQTVNNWWRRGAIPIEKLPKVAQVLRLPLAEIMPKDFARAMREAFMTDANAAKIREDGSPYNVTISADDLATAAAKLSPNDRRLVSDIINRLTHN